MNKLLFKASGLYADLRAMGCSTDEICGLIDAAESSTNDETVGDYVEPINQTT